MIVCRTNDIAFRERPMRESDLTLSREISAGHTTEEIQSMLARSLSPNLPPTSTELISSVNLVTKLPLKNQKR